MDCSREALLRLPFVRPNGDQLDYWSVQTTGDYGLDCELGRAYARALLDYMREFEMPMFLWHIVRDMVATARESDRGIQVGFFHVVSVAVIGERQLAVLILNGDAESGGPCPALLDDLSGVTGTGNVERMALAQSIGS